MALNVGSIVATLKASVDDLKSGFDDATKSVSSFSESTAADFKKVGTSFTVAGAALALMTKSFIDSAAVQETAEKVLENAMVNIAGATLEQVDALKELAAAQQAVGVIGDEVTMTGMAQLATFQVSTGAIGDLTATMQDYAVAMYGAEVSQDQMNATANTFGKMMNGIDISRLKNQGIIVDENQKAILELGTEEEKVLAIQEIMASNLKTNNALMRETTEGALQAMSNSFGDLKEQLGSALLPVVASLAEKLATFLTNLNTNHPNLLKFVGIGIAIAAVLLSILGPILLLIGMLPMLIAGFTSLGVVIAAIFSPVTLIILGIGLLIAAIVYMVVKWDEVVAYLGALWDGLSATATGVFDSIATYFSDLWTSVSETLQVAWDGIILVLSTILTVLYTIISTALYLVLGIFLTVLNMLGVDWEGAWNDMLDVLRMVWEAVSAFLVVAFELFLEVWTGFTTFVSGIWATTWTGISAFFGTIWEGLQAAFEAAATWLSELWTGMADSLSAGWSNMWNGMSDVVSGIWEGIKDTVKSGINYVIDLINSFITKANSIASTVPGMPTISTIPLLAEGGNITGSGAAIVGEAGPELLQLPTGASVTPLDKAGGGITLNFGRDSVRSNEDIQYIKNSVMDALARGQELARFGISNA
jgi:phage-related protein